MQAGAFNLQITIEITKTTKQNIKLSCYLTSNRTFVVYFLQQTTIGHSILETVLHF